MSDSFQPLFSGRPAPGGKVTSMRVEVLSAAGLTPVVGAKPLASAAAPPHAACDSGQPVKVEIEKAGDLVTGLRIHCGCGQVIQLSCSY
jgi:hypothetical protein